MTDTAGVANGESIGARLRAARERAGLSSLQAAAKLHLEPRMIEALEAGEFPELGAPVYVRGHLRRYAELLGAPAGELLDAYAAQVAASAPPDPAQLVRPAPVRAPRQLAGPVVGVIVAGTVIAGIWLALKGLPTATLPDAAPPPAQVTPATDASPPATSPGPAVPDAQTPARAGAPGASAVETPASPAVGTLQLLLSVKEDSWIEVYDARGKRLYFDLARAPATLSVTGPAPLRVLLGYADGVAVEAGGRAIGVPGSVRRGRSAHFVLAADGALSPAP
jgi:cytoskeleton protein RodZ